MSELPSFNTSEIFDMKDGLSSDNPIIVNKDLSCLIKINDIDYYGGTVTKNGTDYINQYIRWDVKLFDKIVSPTDSNPYNYIAGVYDNAGIYDNLSFLTTISYPISMIIWNDVVYVYINPDNFTSTILNEQTIYSIRLVRRINSGDSNEGAIINYTTFYIKFKSNTKPLIFYTNENVSFGNDGYEITITNPVYTIDWNYVSLENDSLKCYQFFLYNNKGKCVTETGKIYTNTSQGYGFICDSLDNDNDYTLTGSCISQKGVITEFPNLIIKTRYNTISIYADLVISQKGKENYIDGENNISAELINLIGITTNGTPTFIDNEKIDLKTTDNSVIFTDKYKYLSDNFLIRIWLNGVKDSEKVTILTLNNQDLNNQENYYINIYYSNGYFYAIVSNGLISNLYVSNSVTHNDVINNYTYLTFLYQSGNVNMYAKTSSTAFS